MSFGKGTRGALGLGDDVTMQDMPRAVGVIGKANGHPVSAISCSTEHSAAVTGRWQVYVWGYGKYGRLGLGDERNHFKPAHMSTMSGNPVVSVKCGELFTALLTTHGDCYTTGVVGTSAAGYALNPGTYLVPRPVEHLVGVKVASIGAGVTHMAAAITPNEVFVWGHTHELDNLGGGSKDEPESAEMLVECLKCGSDANIVSVDCGSGHTMAMSSNGRVWCWGSGKLGQLGSGNYMDTVTPGMVQPFEDRQVAVAIAAGGNATCALTCKGYGNEWDTGKDIGAAAVAAAAAAAAADNDINDRWNNKMDQGPKLGADSTISKQAKKQVNDIANLLSQLGQLDMAAAAEEEEQEEEEEGEKEVGGGGGGGESKGNLPGALLPGMQEGNEPPLRMPPPPTAGGPPRPTKKTVGKKRLSAKLNNVQAIALPPPPPPL
jgi:hypothetical protein